MAALVSSYALKSREIQSAALFPSIGMEAFNIVLHLVGITMASAMLSRKLGWIIQFPNWPRILVLTNLTGAWGFFFTLSVLVDSIGMEISEAVCVLGVFTCIFFYVCTKLTVYLFLAEKVYAVWRTGPEEGRLHCKVYLASLAFIVSYTGIGGLLVQQHIGYLRQDGVCILGISRIASLVLISYDTTTNGLLTLLFVWPLFANRLTLALRGIAIRSLWASTVALVGSCVNVSTIAAKDGRELAWVCLACCGFDVIVNAATLYWVTSGNWDLSRSYVSDEGSTTVIDTVTVGGMVCTNASDIVPGLSTSRANSTRPAAPSPISYVSTASSDSASRRAARNSELYRSLLPERDSSLHDYSEPAGAAAAVDAVCVDRDGRVVDIQAVHRQVRSLALPSLGSGPRPGLQFPWRATSTAPVPDRRQQGRRTTLEIVVTKQTTVTNVRANEDLEVLDPPHCAGERGPQCEQTSLIESRETEATGLEAERDDGVRAGRASV